MDIYKKVFISIGIIIAICLMVCCDNAPKAPTNLVATEIDQGGKIAVALSFDDNSDNEESFLIYRNSELLGSAYLKNKDVPFIAWLAGVDYIDSTVVAGMIYDYQVKAINEHGISESNIATIHIAALPMPCEPFNFCAVPAFHKVKLTWEDTTKQAISFQIFRDGELVKSLEADQFIFIDSVGIDLSTDYEYKIRTLVYQDSSEFVTLNTKTHGEWRAIWEQSERARGYHLYLISNGLPSLIYSGIDTTFVFKVGYFPCAMVGAFNNAGEGLSEVVCAKE